MLALLAGALAAARFLPAAIIEFVGSRRFDALATRINTFFLDVRASLWRAIENLQHRSSLQAGAAGPYVSAPPLASLFQPSAGPTPKPESNEDLWFSNSDAEYDLMLEARTRRA
jgi:hypothetical protein